MLFRSIQEELKMKHSTLTYSEATSCPKCNCLNTTFSDFTIDMNYDTPTLEKAVKLPAVITLYAECEDCGESFIINCAAESKESTPK